MIQRASGRHAPPGSLALQVLLLPPDHVAEYLLLPGPEVGRTLTVEAPGFEPVTVESIVIEADECHVIGVTRDVTLSRS